MRWDDRVFDGLHGSFAWFVSREMIDDLVNNVLRHHLGLRLWIVTFDSGVITPNNGELDAGWTVIGDAMVSPPLTLDLEIPCDQFGEWYIVNHAKLPERTFERFVNYGGFNLADPRKMAESFDPTWERSGLDWLNPIQERFWNQIESIMPVAYICSGDNDIVVTQHREFFDDIRHSHRRNVAEQNDATKPPAGA
jgi:hypothetical protein